MSVSVSVCMRAYICVYVTLVQDQNNCYYRRSTFDVESPTVTSNDIASVQANNTSMYITVCTIRVFVVCTI